MARPAVQLYSLRRVDQPLETVVRRAGELGFDGVEFATRVGDADPDAVAAALEETGLETVAAHVGFETLTADLEATVGFYRDLGCDTLVVPYLDDAHFASRGAIEDTATELVALAERCRDHGIRLCYHNHDHEFVTVDGAPAFVQLLEAADDPLRFEVDLGWVTAAGYDPVALLEAYHEQIPLVHVFDVAPETGEPTNVGDGLLDVDACARAVREHEIEWAIYEHDDPADPFGAAEHGATVLADFE
ncbi:sugar phosphate isomerase/epimerase family protein [Haloarchaeobius amylolyticus]|uniref:sugar phosphate isomerase/epimerase family protein n=1 Tax=Haloarchaeobius amylolyticus TaxID=1198296 RepID=UPI0022710FAE|nr:sugar phosphate isomerase/epimerase [Haloarchaeobius amylolyticus]